MRPGLVAFVTLLVSACASVPPGEDAHGKELKSTGQPVLTALARYYKDNGEYPGSLYELMPRYLDRVPFDLNLNLDRQRKLVGFVYDKPWPDPGQIVCVAPLGGLEWACQQR